MNGLKLLGHPLHPAVVHFPVAGWTSAVVTDVLYLATRNALWWQISQWLLIVGTITALGAMTAGFIDLVALPAGPAQKRALRHMYAMSTAWTIYLVDLLVRFLAGGPSPSSLLAWAALALSVVGFLTLLVGTHFGAQLVYDLGIGQTGRKLS
jgi:uncharacterized membrane protein